MRRSTVLGEYLLTKLHDAGVRHIFGVPGDYVLRFYQQIGTSPLCHVGTTREDTAAFAADGYARCSGIGAVAVTYGVGALNVVNAVAGAYAEASPVVVISGGPGLKERRDDPLIHHRFGPFDFQRQIFERITVAAEVLDDPLTAARQIDRALFLARTHSKPVYLELPRDQVETPLASLAEVRPEVAPDDGESRREAVVETVQLLAAAERPVLLLGVELHRGALQDAVVELIGRLGTPVAATLTGKSVVGERHPDYLGVYEGAMGSVVAKEVVESADLLVVLGVRFNDVDLGIYTAQLDPYHIVRATSEEVFIRHHRYQNVGLEAFIRDLSVAIDRRERGGGVASPGPSAPDFPRPDAPIRVERLIARINELLTPDLRVICDVGDCLFAAVDLRVHQRSGFLASAYYTSMGFAMPAAVGAHFAQPGQRPLVLVGDGAFQMTGTEISTLARHGVAAIVVVFNNAGYSTERFILDGPFNDIAQWRFHHVGDLVGNVQGFDVATEADFESAWQRAVATRDRPSLLNVHLAPDDGSPAMRRLAGVLREKAV